MTVLRIPKSFCRIITELHYANSSLYFFSDIFTTYVIMYVTGIGDYGRCFLVSRRGCRCVSFHGCRSVIFHDCLQTKSTKVALSLFLTKSQIIHFFTRRKFVFLVLNITTHMVCIGDFYCP